MSTLTLSRIYHARATSSTMLWNTFFKSSSIKKITKCQLKMWKCIWMIATENNHTEQRQKTYLKSEHLIEFLNIKMSSPWQVASPPCPNCHFRNAFSVPAKLLHGAAYSLCSCPFESQTSKILAPLQQWFSSVCLHQISWQASKTQIGVGGRPLSLASMRLMWVPKWQC